MDMRAYIETNENNNIVIEMSFKMRVKYWNFKTHFLMSVAKIVFNLFTPDTKSCITYIFITLRTNIPIQCFRYLNLNATFLYTHREGI